MIESFRAALALEAGHPAAHWRLGKALASSGDLEAASEEYELALAADPDFPQALRSLGQVRLALGEDEAARAALRRCLDLHPDDPATRLDLARALRRLGEPVAFEEPAPEELVHDTLPLIDPERLAVQELGVSVLHLRLRAQAFLRVKNSARAEPLLAVARTTTPDDPQLLHLHGRCLAEVGRTAEAAAALDRSLELAPEAKEVWALRARLHEVAGEHGLAARAYERVLELDPKRSNDYYNRGRVLMALRRTDAAKRDFRMFLSTSSLPDDNERKTYAVQALRQ